MQLEWIHIALVIAGAVATMLANKVSNPTPAGPGPITPPSPSPATPANPGAHPLLDAFLALLKTLSTANPQLANLQGINTTLQHPSGNINVSVSAEAGNGVAPKPG